MYNIKDEANENYSFIESIKYTNIMIFINIIIS